MLVYIKFNKMGDILLPLPQRRNRNGHHAQLPLFNCLQRFCVNRCDDFHIYGFCFPCPQASEVTVLKNTEQLRLEMNRHRVDFIQKKRPAVSQFE